MRVFRVCSAKYADTAFSGDGGLYAEARWNYKGVRIVYTAQNLSLAVNETWVHVPPGISPPNYVYSYADLPDDLHVESISGLPSRWKVDETITRTIGTNWLKSLTSAVLQVPAVFIPEEFNYLLNPAHPDFTRILLGVPKPFKFDQRMWKERPATSDDR